MCICEGWCTWVQCQLKPEEGIVFLELQLTGGWSCLMWTLETELRSSAGALLWSQSLSSFLKPLFYIVSVCLCIHKHRCSWLKPDENMRSPGTGVIGSCELLCEYWDLNLGPVEKQPVLLTVSPVLFCDFILSIYFFFWDIVFLCSPRTRSVNQAGLILMGVWLLLPPECWDKRCVHHAQPIFSF